MDSLGGLDSQMYHVENEIQVRAVNIVSFAYRQHTINHLF